MQLQSSLNACDARQRLQAPFMCQITYFAAIVFDCATSYEADDWVFRWLHSEKQKVGQFEIKKSVSTLPLLHEKLEARGLKTASSQLAHVVNRMFTTLEGKGILRVATEEFLLASRYKPHDPLAAEFIRTFRNRNFPGKFFLERYEALCRREDKMDVRVILPKQALGKGVLDVVSLYGFRPQTPDVFYLSPWEFVQWISPVRLGPPNADNQMTKWTAVGKLKLGKKLDDGAMQPGVDFILNEKFVHTLSDVYAFPNDAAMFGGKIPETYFLFRNTWVLRMRKRPMVPSPEVCPMPNRRKSKESRCKILSVYLRPWTLFRQGGTLEVPFLANLQYSQEQLREAEQMDADPHEIGENGDLRAAWKEYNKTTLPHAFRQIRNFMLASIAEGRNFEDEEESMKRGDAVRCDLSLADIDKALKQHSVRPSNLNADEGEVCADDENGTGSRVWKSTHLALQLASLTEVSNVSAVSSAKNITKLCWSKTSSTSFANEEGTCASAAQVFSSTARLETADWKDRHEAWCAEVFQNATTKTPNAKQKQILDLIHFRRIVEHARENDMEIPADSPCAEPLLRLVHGLPGAGKTQVLRWVKSYFEDVWSTYGSAFYSLTRLVYKGSYTFS